MAGMKLRVVVKSGEFRAMFTDGHVFDWTGIDTSGVRGEIVAKLKDHGNIEAVAVVKPSEMKYVWTDDDDAD